LDFVAYVAKDAAIGRACYVLECGSGLAQDVITTIGQAFELRFEEYLNRLPGMGHNNNVPGPDSLDSGVVTADAASKAEQYSSKLASRPHAPKKNGFRNDDPEYYNDLPGKIPPDSVTLPPTPLTGVSTASTAIVGGGTRGPRAAQSASDLIDLSSEPNTPLTARDMVFDENVHQYVNDPKMNNLGGLPATPWSPPPTATSFRDPFDMREYRQIV
jgi:hypothetical protein